MRVAAGHLHATGPPWAPLLFGAMFMIIGITAFIRPEWFENTGWFPGRGGRFGEPLPPMDPADFDPDRPWDPLDPAQVPPARVQARMWRVAGPVFAVVGLGIFILGIVQIA